MWWLRFLGLPDTPPSGADQAETDTVRRISQALEQLDPDESRRLAAFAYVLSRVASADLHVSGIETRAMERIVARHGNLPEAQAVLVVQIAKSQSRLFGGTENFLVTREFERLTGREEKLALLDCLYAIAAADGTVSVAEDNEIGRIASELRLDRRDLVSARLAYRDQLAVLRPPGEEPSEPPDP